MRVALVAIAVAVGVLFAIEQGLASVALREDAQKPSWIAFVPAGLAARVDALSADLLLPEELRLVLARRALEDGRVDAAEAQVARLGSSRDRDELAGLLAERRGDEVAAVRAFLAAGDVDGVTRRVARLETAGDIDEALRLQQTVVERVRGDPAEAGALPEAYYRLGGLEQTAAYKLDPAEREPLEQQSLHDYERAVVLAPIEERYLIAAGNELINLGDLDGAREYFRRAHDVNPNSVDALTGFGDIALRLGSAAEAQAYLKQAQRINPNADSVRRLAQQLESH